MQNRRMTNNLEPESTKWQQAPLLSTGSGRPTTP